MSEDERDLGLPERPELRLMVVGHDPRPAWWRGEVRSRGLEQSVLLLGGRRDAEACYAAADLYVLPTRYEPFANSTLEALASGLPVITTDTTGGSELIEWSAPSRARAARAAARALGERHDSNTMAAATVAVLQEVRAELVAGTPLPPAGSPGQP